MAAHRQVQRVLACAPDARKSRLFLGPRTARTLGSTWTIACCGRSMACSRRIAAVLALVLAACATNADDVGVSSDEVETRAPLHLNEIQVKGTHNSYHVAGLLSHPARRYTHAPIEEQLEEQGVRSLELDLHVGGDLALRVYHVDLDRRTRCATLGECLTQIKAWSDRHPSHVPIFVMLEEKEIEADASAYYRELDRTILSIWPRERLVTPALVRGSATTLRDAITTRGWPMLDDARGKIGLFLTAMSGERKTAFRAAEHIAFPTGWLDEPDVGILVIDDPREDPSSLVDAVRRGYLVRTRADAAMEEVWDEDLERFRAGLGGGAHFISTDQPVPGRLLHDDYDLEMPIARCNAVVGPSWCKSLARFDVESMR
jgi:hypothetical protein